MSTQPLTPRPARRIAGVSQSLGAIVFGGILILIGGAWLLDVLDVVSLTAGLILPTALILVGLALLAGSMSGSNGGLVALGIVLTVILTLSASVNVPLNGGIGDRSYSPTQITDLPDHYQLMIGNLEIDLSQLDIPAGESKVDARVGIGELIIDVPRDVAVLVHWKISGGNIEALDRSDDGVNLDDRIQTSGYETAARKLIVEASMGFGDIKVRQP